MSYGFLSMLVPFAFGPLPQTQGLGGETQESGGGLVPTAPEAVGADTGLEVHSELYAVEKKAPTALVHRKKRSP